jgi:vitamin B12 transporter
VKSIYRFPVLAALSALVLPAAAHAQDLAPDEVTANAARKPFDERSDIVVTATGSAAPITQSGQSITLLTADEIASLQGPDVLRVLQRLPGVSLSRNGGLGSATSLFVRGANSEQTLVVIDGVRVEDVAAPSGGYDFGGLSAGGVGRIELLRGSNSVIWGSDAIGGVLAVTSRTLNGAEASLEYGSRNTVDAQANAGLIRDAYEFTLNGGYTRTDGISAAATGTEPDGFEQWRIGGHGKLALAPGLDLVATARYVHSQVDIDGYAPPTYAFGDTPEYQVSKQASGRVGLAYAAGALTLNTGVALADTRRSYFDPSSTPNPNYATSGRSIRPDLTGHLALPAHFSLDFGAASEWTRFRAESFAFGSVDSGKDNLTSGHALLGWHSDRLDLAAGARIDSHSRFGTHWTYGVNGAFRIIDDLRLRASYGEGFKAPTLYQLLSQYGNTALQPETSRSYDVGLEKGDRSGRVHAAVTWFGRDISNLIDFISCADDTGICKDRPFGTYGAP